MAVSARSQLEDHALERVPDHARRGWRDLTWNTVGIVTTLATLFEGAVACFIAGLPLGLAAGVLVACVGSVLGWAVGHIAHQSGLSSTVMSRHYGFGTRGSTLCAAIFGTMMVGLLGIENILLYKGLLFFFRAEDTLAHRLLAYGVMTVVWTGLTAYGFAAVTRVSSLMVIAFLAVLAYMLARILAGSGYSGAELLSFGTQFPAHLLAQFGAGDSASSRFVAAVNLLMGPVGALMLFSADLGRYARRSRDVGIAAILGNVFFSIIMLVVGAAVVYAGMPAMTEYYTATSGLDAEHAARKALESPDAIAASFIVFGGALGAFLVLMAQAKAQVLNAYSASLSLTNLADGALGWRPGRIYFVVIANLGALVFLYDDLLRWFYGFLVSLGVLTTGIAAIMLADYYLVRSRETRAAARIPIVNLAGVATLLTGFVLARFVLNEIVTLQAATVLAASVLLYPPLRRLELRFAVA